jgi:hypothetical protein
MNQAIDNGSGHDGISRRIKLQRPRGLCKITMTLALQRAETIEHGGRHQPGWSRNSFPGRSRDLSPERW